MLSRFSRVDSVWPLETINIFQEIKEKIEKKIAEKMGEFCQIIEMHQKKKKKSTVNSRPENAVSLIKNLQGGLRIRLHTDDGERDCNTGQKKVHKQQHRDKKEWNT